mmetsp:Transcript_9356/g.18475  ORF Transcript_9356/g.18475 Transcript_9356/m.18475 type:complete len:82 (+) Transcript_9356:576-821(+)
MPAALHSNSSLGSGVRSSSSPSRGGHGSARSSAICSCEEGSGHAASPKGARLPSQNTNCPEHLGCASAESSRPASSSGFAS